MANEDLLERANAQADILHDCGFELNAKLMRELAAEVRELRRDKARLDWMLRNTNDDILSRVDLDAAMGEEG